MGYEISSLIAGVHIKIFHPLPVKMSHVRAQSRDRMVEMSSRDIIEHRINHSFFIYISYQVYLNFFKVFKIDHGTGWIIFIWTPTIKATVFISYD